jgi:hypothetical protein
MFDANLWETISVGSSMLRVCGGVDVAMFKRSTRFTASTSPRTPPTQRDHNAENRFSIPRGLSNDALSNGAVTVGASCAFVEYKNVVLHKSCLVH